MDAPLLTRPGSVSHSQAVSKAEAEHGRYREQFGVAPSEVESAYLVSLKRAPREIDKGAVSRIEDLIAESCPTGGRSRRSERSGSASEATGYRSPTLRTPALPPSSVARSTPTTGLG